MVKKILERGNDSEFHQMLIDMKRKSQSCATLGEVVDCILSFDGRFPVKIGKKSLTRLQKAMVDVLGPSKKIFFSDYPVGAPRINFGVTEYGRIILSQDSLVESDDLIFGYVTAAEAEWRRINALKSAADDETRRGKAEVEEFFAAVSDEYLREILNTVEHMVDHVDPVLIYVEDRTFTLYGKRNNLLDRVVRRRTVPGNTTVGKALVESRVGRGDFLFTYLRHRKIGEWNDDEKMFIYCMYWLKQSGGRGEEFNGLQLTHPGLHEHFDDLAETLRRAGLNSANFPANATIPQKAACVNEWKQEIKQSHITYRIINGLNFYKIEDFLARREVASGELNKLPKSLKEYFGETYDMPVERYGTLGELSREWVLKVFAGDARHKDPDKFPTAIEELLHEIVKSAVEESDSDIGMTRCIRSIAKVKKIHDAGCCAEACNWPVSDYYCCVVPSARWADSMKSRGNDSAFVLYAIAKRMEYNSWHYTPGYYESSRVPDGRHFFIPPAMPDLTEWSNMHHGGHIIANVLFSIRSPGSLHHDGREFNGLFDLRLMRQEGEPYSVEDLKRALVFTGYLKSFYQALMDFVCSNCIEFSVTAFTKSWYDFHYSGNR
ncbi:MAG: hypothetical protein ACLGJB_10935 [Blastocatellia bacterium]